jgi:hypothetical protein
MRASERNDPWSLLAAAMFSALLLPGCGSDDDGAGASGGAGTGGNAGGASTGGGGSGGDADAAPSAPDPFADRVVSFTPGATAGFGQDQLPDVVLGPPQGAGSSAGSIDVLSLGDGGCIVLEFTDVEAVDRDGIDLLVFENSWGGYFEPGIVSVSTDGATWATFACATEDSEGGFPGCAGTHPVFSSPDNGISATDPSVAGGDGYDLLDVGLGSARFVRVCDAAVQYFSGVSGGFDLDAVAVVNGASIQP